MIRSGYGAVFSFFLNLYLGLLRMITRLPESSGELGLVLHGH